MFLKLALQLVRGGWGWGWGWDDDGQMEKYSSGPARRKHNMFKETNPKLINNSCLYIEFQFNPIP